MSPEQVVDVWNRRAILTNRFPRALTKTAIEEAQVFLRWCAKSKISDPDAFIRFRFQRSGGKLIPIRKLKAPGLVGQFREFGGDLACRSRLEERTSRSVRAECQGRPTVFTELLKARLVLSPQTCALSPDAGGWHPDSEWCVRCPLAEQCKRRLSPHTMAVRIVR